MSGLEIIGIAANVIAVVDLANKAGNAVYSYIKSAKDCPETASKLHKELAAVQVSLQRLVPIAKKLDIATKAGQPAQNLSATSDLSASISECLSTISDISTQLQGHFTNRLRARFRRRLKWPIKEPKVREFIQDLSRYQQTFQLTLQLDIAEVTLRTEQAVHTSTNMLLETVSDGHQVALRTETAVHGVSDVILAVRNEQTKKNEIRDLIDLRQDINKLVAWLLPLSYNHKHDESWEKHEEGTGDWLFENPAYQRWEAETRAPSLLWIYGIPGCGKTILASSVIERLESAKLRHSSFVLAYHYCQYNKEETRSTPAIFRSIICQLLSSFPNQSIVWEQKTVQILFQKMSRGEGPPNGIKQLMMLVFHIARLHRRVMLVLDGLDECHRDTRASILEFISLMQDLKNVNILVLSRPEVDIMDELKSYPAISLEEQQKNLKEDMVIFIKKEFQNTRKWSASFQRLRDHIIEALILGSGRNMFRWLECQLALINKLRTEKEIRHALTVLPQTLFESYDRLLELIDGKYAELVLKVLHLIIVFPTVAPSLPVHTILDGISPIDERGYIDRSATFLDSRILLQECGVLLRENGDYFQTCHYSVEEYLQSNYLRTHEKLASYYVTPDIYKRGIQLLVWMLKYLLAADFSTPCLTEADLKKRLTEHPFFYDCASSWEYILRGIRQKDNELAKLLCRYANSLGNVRSAVQLGRLCHGSDRINGHLMLSDQDLLHRFLLPALESFPSWIAISIFEGRPELVNICIANFGSPLRIAIINKRKNLAIALVELGADIHQIREYTETWTEELREFLVDFGEAIGKDWREFGCCLGLEQGICGHDGSSA